jgi:hypothetical protein
MSTDPESIRQDIERTQAELSTDVNALTEKVSPRQAVGRRVERAKGAFRTTKDKVMGTAAGVGETASAAAGEVSSAVSSTPQMVAQRTQGNPLTAGLVAFGAGALISSLFPRSEKERQLARQVKQQATQRSDQIKEQVTGTAQQVREELREPAQQAMESVKSTAGEAASTVREESTAGARDGRQQARGRAKQTR